MEVPEGCAGSRPCGAPRRPPSKGSVPRIRPSSATDGAPKESEAEEGGQCSSRSEDPSLQNESSSRCDPALRDALQRLDAVRRQQPRPDDFGLERFLEDGVPGVAASRTRPSVEGLRTCFSTALLLAAARQPTRGGAGRPARPPSSVVSRSTSPGSTLDSSTSGSLGGFSNMSGSGPGSITGGSVVRQRGGRSGGYEAVPLPPGVPQRARRCGRRTLREAGAPAN